MAIYVHKPGFKYTKRTGIPDGMNRAEAKAYRVEAEIIAWGTYEILRTSGLLMDENDPNLTAEERLDNQRANDAMLELLTLGKDLTVPADVRVKALSVVANILKPRAINPKSLRIPTVQNEATDLLSIIGRATTVEAVEFRPVKDETDD